MRDITVHAQVSGTPADQFPVSSPTDWWDTIWAHVAPYVPMIVGVSTLAFTVLMTRAGMRALTLALQARRARQAESKTKNPPPSLEDWLTWFMAAIATSVSASGMWKFAGDVLKLDGFFRVLFFAFIEGAIVISALRARKSMRDNYTAGVDGIAVWALAALTAVLASLDAKSAGEVIFRLVAPLVAAWLWERGMRLERRRLRGLSGINWRLTPERVLVWLGLAEVTDRTASEVDAHRRLTRVALAAKKVHQLREAGAPQRKIRAALVKRDRALDQAVEHTGLARDERMQWALLDMVTTLGGADSLSEVLGGAKAPWAMLDHPAVTGAAKHREAVQLAEAMREWTDAIKQQRDPEVSAAITSMAAYIAGRDGIALTDAITSADTSPSAEVIDNRTPARREAVNGHAPLTVLDLVTEPITADASDDDRTGDSDGDNDDDRDRPDEQDNREAEEWIRRRCRGRNGVGRKPTQREVAEHFGFSMGWARNRITNEQSRMIARGYQFEPDGTVYAPARSGSDSDASTREEASA